MGPQLDEDQREFQTNLARWVDERLVPRAEELDHSGDFARDLFVELAELGYLGLMYPEEYGGSGVPNPHVYFTILCEELARGSMGFAATVCMHGSTATHTIHAWGSEDLRQRYLVPALRGEKVGAFAITEAGAGSDAAAVRTRVDRVQGGYLLNGTKMFTSNGAIADFVTIVATSEPGKGAKAHGLYLVDTTSPGFSVGRRLEKFTTHCSDTVELVLQDVFVPDSQKLGDSATNAYKALTVDRIFTAALALGTGRAAYDAAVRYAGERSQFGQPIGKFQAVQFRLVDMLAKLEQARLYTYHAASLADSGQSITTEAALAKIIAAENCNEVCQKAMSVFGGWGLMTEFPVQRFLRDSYFPMVGGGTGDIMRLVVARQIGL
ncbi:acyl-CoA dehydrogenase [Roseomonas sp. KE2513]|uniref:acyl-CoA dehydrogenase family protein n=1 Tax=Roseomonas sp. KE2513 TaxID=2479202 RepID=UPI0018DF78ED|nr:acyl-CoA dehydrogenase family protein [Roseomonas sp. KE2513]MBI0538800.1 acyl-CoA dehydrogenase [Roseomonas sp. KE2513]